MADEITPEQATELADKFIRRYLEKAAELHLKPYVGLIGESLRRSLSLVSQAAKADKETAAEILRSVVVLNHAYLEDFLRNIALWLLPAASEETLNEVPLSGSRHAEKFWLGKLAKHRGKTVDDFLANQ